jgi:hypothetical protein
VKKQSRQINRSTWLLLPLLLIGCSSSAQSGKWTGPTAAAKVSVEQWSFGDRPGQILKTQHYLIHTTISDEEVLHKLPQMLEGAYQQYQMFVSAPMRGSGPMRCYIFARRSEWAEFTRQHTGADAAIYLQITRGGYTIGDWFVSYYVGDTATFSVTAHEGWHQYVSRHFKGRLPPFLEEGTACMFESVRFPGDLPRWDLSINPNRTLGLRSSIDRRALWPLNKLVAMHAGDVVQLPGDKIESFYAQNWAFARFLWEYNNGQYRPAFKKMLADVASGNPYDPSGTMHRSSNQWSPSGVRPMLEHYLGKNLDLIEVEFQQFMHDIAYTHFGRQWSARSG